MLERRTTKFTALRSIRGKLFCLRIGIGVAMAFTLGIFCYFIMSRSMAELRENELNRETQLTVDLISRTVAEHKKALLEIARSEPVKKYFQNYSLNMIQGYLKLQPTPFDSVGLVDEDGMMEINLVHGQALLESANLKNDPDYMMALETAPGQALMSPPRLVGYLREYALIYDFMATDFFDNRLSFVRATFALGRFTEVFTRARLETLNNIFIVNNDGQVIYSSEKREDLGRKITEVSGLLRNIWAADQPTGEYNFAGESFKYKRDVIPELGWQILVTTDLTAWNAPIVKLRNEIILFALLLVVLSEILSRLIGLRITEPITRLNRLAQTIVHSGRLSDRVEWQSMDELGELAQSVNLMLDRLEHSHNQLSAEKQFVDNVLASMVDGMAICGADGKIIKTNKTLTGMLGFAQPELVGKPVTAILPAEAITAVLHLVMDRAHPFQRFDDTLAPMKGGDRLPVSCTISMVYNLAEELSGFLVILTDISGRKRLEQARESAESRLRDTQEELLKTEKMAVVGQMAGMVAHEVLNPISAIKIRVDLSLPKAQELFKVLEVLSRIIHDWRDAEQKGNFKAYFAASGPKDLAILTKISDSLLKRQTDRIEDLEFLDRQLMRVIKIIDNLREMSRREKTIEKVSLDKLLNEVMDDLSDGIRKRGIKLHCNYRAAPVVMADYMELYSIFSNIIKNSMQAIDKQADGAERRIWVMLDVANAQQSLVEIRDSGIGMTAEQCEAVFTTGFTSKGRQGTGIGTSFARKLARQFGGDILLKESVPGQGTTFQVLLAMEEKQ